MQIYFFPPHFYFDFFFILLRNKTALINSDGYRGGFFALLKRFSPSGTGKLIEFWDGLGWESSSSSTPLPWTLPTIPNLNPQFLTRGITLMSQRCFPSSQTGNKSPLGQQGPKKKSIRSQEIIPVGTFWAEPGRDFLGMWPVQIPGDSLSSLLLIFPP